MQALQIKGQEKRKNKYANARVRCAYVETIERQIFKIGVPLVAELATWIVDIFITQTLDINITLEIDLTSFLAHIIRLLLNMYRKWSKK